ncbi:50S ribosomal protein L11 methyltransferase [Micromonospora cathayae]|uniref:50S ribosomal protein L11 methyltransferase n=1 Tax=Micromonospora cathayae TaxID=3028804 RepID=A0ABY7ZMQ1_9ACTN|nr:50S ribosomal protein L11 methyltransferase [Micromonospora sp. HUAS 3]WDZ83711.1 50S ribosomal protein L11 methyltransferase [Micromonospora sp. HUAS 3]
MARLAAATSRMLAQLAADPASEAIPDEARNLIPRWHFAMLNDHERNDALAVALERQIVSGSRVLDIGSGTGLLAMMAIRAGAAHVTSCETNPVMAEIAREIVADHGMSDVITIVPKRSTDLVVGRDLPEPVDFLVSEIVDCGLIGEGILPTISHAREQLLAPGGQMLPRSARLLGCLVESPVVMSLNQTGTAAGFDVRQLNTVATRGHFPVRLNTWPHRIVSDVVELASFDLAHGTLADGSSDVRLTTTERGTAHALVAWFEMDLGAGVVIRNSPDNLRSHWMQALVPIGDPLAVSAGDRVALTLTWHGTRLGATTHHPADPAPED